MHEYYDSSIYSAAFRQLYEPVSQHISIHHFAAELLRYKPQLQIHQYQPFRVSFYTLPGKRRARRFTINPNSKNCFQAMLWDIRHAMSTAWCDVKHRVSLMLNGMVLEPTTFVTQLRRHCNYALQVTPDINGQFELPHEDPLAEEVAAREREEARQRATMMQTDARDPSVTQPWRVRQAIATEFGRRMTSLACDVNSGRKGNRFAIISEPVTARANAQLAVRQAPIYGDLGYSSAEEFFEQGLHARSGTEAINTLAGNIAAHMRSMPTNVRTNDSNELQAMYASKAISAPIFQQWGDTVRKWIDSAKTTLMPSTADFRLRNDYSLAAKPRAYGSRDIVAPMRFQVKQANAPDHVHDVTVLTASSSPMPAHKFAERTDKTERRLERWNNERTMMNNMILVTDDGTALPVFAVPGASLVAPDSMPVGRPIGDVANDSMPAAIDAPVDSMPAARPINAQVDSVPEGRPINAQVDSVPAARPINLNAAAVQDSVWTEPSGDTAAQQLYNSTPAVNPMPLRSSSGRSLFDRQVTPAADYLDDRIVYESLPNAARMQSRSASLDPLARQMVRPLMQSHDYSGVMIPDLTALGAQQREALAAQMAKMSDSQLASSIAAYLLPRETTAPAINALLSGSAEPRVSVPSANGKSWTLESAPGGRIAVHNHQTKQTHAATVWSVEERPQTVMILMPVDYKSGQK